MDKTEVEGCLKKVQRRMLFNYIKIKGKFGIDEIELSSSTANWDW